MAENEQTTPGATPDPTDDQPTEQPEQLGDKGKAALEAERQARKDADKRARDAEKKLADLEAERQREADEKAQAQGKFEELATKRAEQLDKAKTDMDAIKAERDALAERIQAFEDRDRQTITDGIRDLPPDLVAFDPGEDAPLEARMSWFSKAVKIAADRTTSPTPGTGRAPDPATTQERVSARREALVASGRYEAF